MHEPISIRAAPRRLVANPPCRMVDGRYQRLECRAPGALRRGTTGYARLASRLHNHWRILQNECMSRSLRIAPAVIVMLWPVANPTFAWADAPAIPPASRERITFSEHIEPILSRRCSACHAGRERNGGLSINSRRELLGGGESGAAVVLGRSGKSLLIELVSGLDDDRVMPAEGERLTRREIGLLRAWIDQNVPWPADFRLGGGNGSGTGRLAPRRPDLPTSRRDLALSSPIDLILDKHFRQRGDPFVEPVSDRLFARRVWLDLVGLLPSPGELEAFVNDGRPDKRRRLVRQLLNDRRAYATHWMSFWNDLLRNEYRGTGFIDGGRQQITGWLFEALYENKPYDRFVHELLSPVDGSQGFTKGIIWRGVVNASQRPEMQAAQNIAQVFLGTNLKCASCHDSFVNQWKLADAYALASVFADDPLEIYRCDKPTGETAEVGFLFPRLGRIEASAPKNERMTQLADLVTSEQNGRLTRTIVNRLWARLFGRGLVEPVDEMENDPWNADLLDWLAVDLSDNQYDLKHTLEIICASRAYQLPSVGEAAPDRAAYVFRGPLVRRMTAEQFVDAVSALAGLQRETGSQLWESDGRGQGGQFAAVRDVLVSYDDKASLAVLQSAKWIWNDRGAAADAAVGHVYFRKDFQLATIPQQAVAAISCDNGFTLFVNGRKVAAGKDWREPQLVDLSSHFVAGRNLLAVEAVNGSQPERDETSKRQPDSPAGLMFVAIAGDSERPTWSLWSDATWICSDEDRPGWDLPDFDTAGWTHAFEVADATSAPWHLADRLAASLGLAENVRAALLMSDSLMRALGRPVREQVATRRDSPATLLQALELTNGQTLHQMLRDGARNLLMNEKVATDDLIDELYRKALGRGPSDAERATSARLVGSPPTQDGVADFLWALVMLAEFQLIY